MYCWVCVVVHRGHLCCCCCRAEIGVRGGAGCGVRCSVRAFPVDVVLPPGSGGLDGLPFVSPRNPAFVAVHPRFHEYLTVVAVVAFVHFRFCYGYELVAVVVDDGVTVTAAVEVRDAVAFATIVDSEH